MPVSIVVGGQFGSEGKGKVTAHLCRTREVAIAVRCGGPNSGHTVYMNGEPYGLREIPAGVVSPGPLLCLAPGSLIDLDVLLREVRELAITPERLRIDRNAVIVEEADKQLESSQKLGVRYGSTCTGTGAAVARRALRSPDVRLAQAVSILRPYIADVASLVADAISVGSQVVIEGTQGFGLSLYHSPFFPYVTSRDTTASAFASEVGVSPRSVEEIIQVIRTFPIRVAGDSGPLKGEISWETIQAESSYEEPLGELTTVTHRLRRVARFDLEMVSRACMVNQPSRLALMGTDYLNARNRGVFNFEQLTFEARSFIERLERSLGVPVDFVGTGPSDFELIDRIAGRRKHGSEGSVQEVPLRVSLP